MADKTKVVSRKFHGFKEDRTHRTETYTRRYPERRRRRALRGILREFGYRSESESEPLSYNH